MWITNFPPVTSATFPVRSGIDVSLHIVTISRCCPILCLLRADPIQIKIQPEFIVRIMSNYLNTEAQSSAAAEMA